MVEPDRKDWALGAAEAKEGQAGIDWKPKLKKGMEVLGFDGGRIGRIKELRENDFVIDRRMQPDAHVGYKMIDSLVDDKVTLILPSHHVDDKNWQPEGNLGERPLE